MARNVTTHEHESADGDDSVGMRTLALVSVINLAGFFIELAGGLLFGSVALVSDSTNRAG